MPEPHVLLAWAAASLVIIVVPGPGVLFAISRSVALGPRAGVLTVVGHATGVYVQVLAVALGLGALLARSVVAFEVVKAVGAVYLVYLGVQQIRHRRRIAAAAVDPAEAAPLVGSRTVLRQAFVVGIANPKAAVFFAAVLPQFVAPGRGPVAVQMLVLGLVFLVIALISDTAWALTAGAAHRRLGGSTRTLERLSAGGGVVLIGLGARLALSGRA